MNFLITRGRPEADAPTPPAAAAHPLGRAAVLLVGLSDASRRRLAAGDPVHVQVPLDAELLDLVIIASDAPTVPPKIGALLARASIVVQVTDEEE